MYQVYRMEEEIELAEDVVRDVLDTVLDFPTELNSFLVEAVLLRAMLELQRRPAPLLFELTLDHRLFTIVNEQTEYRHDVDGSETDVITTLPGYFPARTRTEKELMAVIRLFINQIVDGFEEYDLWSHHRFGELVGLLEPVARRVSEWTPDNVDFYRFNLANRTLLLISNKD